MDSLLPLLHLMLKLEAFKRTDRTGWNKKDFPPGSPCVPRTVKNAESVADHSWGLAMFASLVAKQLKLDAEKMMAMALVHDLAERITGDIVTIVLPPDQRAEAKARKRVLEDAAMQETFLPLGDLGRYYYDLWLEYEDGTSAEARVLHQLDKIETCTQALWYSREKDKEGNLQNEVVAEEFLNNIKGYVYDPQFVALLDELRRLAAEPNQDVAA